MLPRPPINTMTDFVVFCFVSVVVIVLMITATGVLVDTFVHPDNDRSNTINAMSDIITTLIGALVGFIAGKGTGRAEAQDEEQQRRDEAGK